LPNSQPNSQEDRQVRAERSANGPAGIHAAPPYRPISGTLAIAPTVSVIIPARNEAANLPHVLDTLPPWTNEIVLVDGHSVDDTVAVTQALCPEAKVITQPGRGKGDALQAGFAAATGDILVMIDADGSTDGAEIIRFVSALVAGADFAKGSRFSSGGGSDDITGLRRYGNRLLSVLVNRMFGTHFTDLCYGYNAFWARHLGAIEVSGCSGFEVETLMSIRAVKAGLKIYEVPSHECPRIFGASNLHAVRDGWRILKIIVRERLSGLRKSGSRRPAGQVTAPFALSVMADSATGPYRMPRTGREPSVHDRDIVAAMVEGDPAGVAAALGRHGQGIHAYCRSLLSDRADAAGAVRDTFAIASAEISRLREPDRLRAWLFALARNECQRRCRAAAPSARLYEAAHAMDDTGSFAAITQQAGFRAQVRAALAGMDPVDREISELYLRHGFYGADLADILGVPPGQAHTLASRARSRFERSLGVLLLARSAWEHCPRLAAILNDPGGKPAPSLRWRVKRHTRRCEICGVRKRNGLNPAILLGLLPVVPLPAGLRRQALRLISDRSPTAAAERVGVLDRAARFRADGFPAQLTTPSAAGRRITSAAALAAAAAALALLGGAMYYVGHRPAPAAGSQSASQTGPNRSTDASPGARRGPVVAPAVVPAVPRPGASAPSPFSGHPGQAASDAPASQSHSPSASSPASPASPAPSSPPSPSSRPSSSQPPASVPPPPLPSLPPPLPSLPAPLPSLPSSSTPSSPTSATSPSPATAGTSN
jgi:RNA polymerase sigma factor (sigma-70 family)